LTARTNPLKSAIPFDTGIVVIRGKVVAERRDWPTNKINKTSNYFARRMVSAETRQYCLPYFSESLILAQNERWRRG
jgi:hypothetical protein